MKKYVGAVLWKSFQLVIPAEIDEQPQNNVLAKIIHLFPATELLKKNKTICWDHLLFESCRLRIVLWWYPRRIPAQSCEKDVEFSEFSVLAT